MSAPRFHHAGPLRTGETVELSDTAARHVQVLRLQAGDPITLFNGEGGEYRAHLTEVHRKRVSAQITEFADLERESPLILRLIQAISKGDRMDYTVQKAVELGVNHIQPVFSERSVVRLKGERLEKKLAHWQGIAISSCEQCGRNRPPAWGEIMDLNDALAAAKHHTGIRLVLDPRATTSLGNLPEDKTYTLLSGPEGGFTDQEIDTALAHGFTGIRMGPRILRTETAAIAATAALQARFGDLG